MYNEEIKKALTNIDTIVGSFGADDETTIDTAVSLCMEVKEVLSNFSEKVDLLESDVERLNIRCNELRTANNNLSRVIYSKDEALEQQKKEIDDIQALSQLF